jgi:hypothetical protein
MPKLKGSFTQTTSNKRADVLSILPQGLASIGIGPEITAGRPAKSPDFRP